VICSAAGSSWRMVGDGRRMRLYFALYALTISVVRSCQSPRLKACVRKEWRLQEELYRESSPRN